MSLELSSLIDALREELTRYGEMLAQLEQQHEWLIQRRANRLLECATRLEVADQSLDQARRQRTARQRTLARALGLREEASFG